MSQLRYFFPKKGILYSKLTFTISEEPTTSDNGEDNQKMMSQAVSSQVIIS